jgi:TATA-binding protein-associated factor
LKEYFMILTRFYVFNFRLQKFKLMTARTVISEENAGLETMGTEGLLDLFVLEEGQRSGGGGSGQKSEDVGGIVGAYRNVLDALPELWEDKLYEDEYDLSTFIRNLAK